MHICFSIFPVKQDKKWLELVSRAQLLLTEETKNAIKDVMFQVQSFRDHSRCHKVLNLK